MMKGRRTILVSALAVLAASGLAYALMQPRQSEEPTETPVQEAPDEDLAMFADYRNWHKVNPEPLKLLNVLDGMCVITPETIEEAKSNPHRESYWLTNKPNRSFTVFVNEVGKSRMLKETDGEFPVGTIIVKEKHEGKDASSSVLLTAMVKREKGFAPDLGDWEFFVLDGLAKGIQGRGEPKHCVTCHARVPENDFVFTGTLKPYELFSAD